METVTLQGPVVVLSTGDYQNLTDRIEQLEDALRQLIQLLEDLSDIQAMRQAETEHQMGDRISFDDLLAEIDVEEAAVGVSG